MSIVEKSRKRHKTLKFLLIIIDMIKILKKNNKKVKINLFMNIELITLKNLLSKIISLIIT